MGREKDCIRDCDVTAVIVRIHMEKIITTFVWYDNSYLLLKLDKNKMDELHITGS